MSHLLENAAASHLRHPEVLTKKENLVLLAAKVNALEAMNRNLRQKVSNQRQQLRRLQALYNAYLIGCKGGAHQVKPGNVQFLSCEVSGEIPDPLSGLMEHGRKMEVSA